MLIKLFGERIKKLRAELCMSQDELAKIANIDRAQLSRIEQGKLNITLETIERLSNALRISLPELFTFNTNTLDRDLHPFVKWAGGKSQIIDKLIELLPKSYNRYFEPFVGGGALLLTLKPNIAFINDTNSELMCVFECLQNKANYKLLINELVRHEENHSEEYYYIIRGMDKEPNFSHLPIHVRAARMIYLNKACFNGLYRVNSKGFFNVPSGKKAKVNTFDRENMELLYQYFTSNKIKLLSYDFEKAVEEAQAGDFVYFDPPYDTLEDKNSFTSYGKEAFGKKEQIRLSEVFKSLSKKGVYVMLSNHNTPLINELYAGFNIHVITARRNINSKGDGRGLVEEVIITNY